MTQDNQNFAHHLTVEQIEKIWHSLPGREIIQDKPQHMWEMSIREAFARALVNAQKELEAHTAPPWNGDGLPPIGAEVLIRHGRDDDDHLCVVTGYSVSGSLDGNVRTHRVTVNLVYKGTDTSNSRMLCDIRPAGKNSAGWTAPHAPKPSQVVANDEDRIMRQEYETTLQTIAGGEWTVEQVKDLAARSLKMGAAEPELAQGSIRKTLEFASSSLEAIEADVTARGYRVFNDNCMASIREVIATLGAVAQKAVALEGRPIVKPVAAYRAYGIMRKMYRKGEAKEVFHGAQWHDQIRLEEDERLTQGWFITEDDTKAGTGLGQGPRAVEIIR